MPKPNNSEDLNTQISIALYGEPRDSEIWSLGNDEKVHEARALNPEFKRVKALIESKVLGGKIEELRRFGENSGYEDYASDRINELQSGRQDNSNG